MYSDCLAAIEAGDISNTEAEQSEEEAEFYKNETPREAEKPVQNLEAAINKFSQKRHTLQFHPGIGNSAVTFEK